MFTLGGTANQATHPPLPPSLTRHSLTALRSASLFPHLSLQLEEGLSESALDPILGSEPRLAAWRQATLSAAPCPRRLMASLLLLERFVRPEWVKPHWRPWAVPAPLPRSTGECARGWGSKGGGAIWDKGKRMILGVPELMSDLLLLWPHPGAGGSSPSGSLLLPFYSFASHAAEPICAQIPHHVIRLYPSYPSGRRHCAASHLAPSRPPSTQAPWPRCGCGLRLSGARCEPRPLSDPCWV